MSNELLDWLEDTSPQIATEDVAAQLIAFNRVAEAEYVLKMQERIKALEDAIRWACGETNFRQRKEGEGQYYWRKELRERAQVPWVAPTAGYNDERNALRESMHVCNARTELVVALHTVASHFENALGLFGEDIEARNHAEGSIRHAMQVAAKHNENGKGCLIYLPKPEDSSDE